MTQEAFATQDLASALNDVVQIERNGHSSTLEPKPPSLPGTKRSTPSPNPAYTRPSGSSSATGPTKVKLPSQRLRDEARNPFESEEGEVLDDTTKSSRTMAEEDRKAKASSSKKKASRHADVIDTWDPTGGVTMWHHSGPYDAAAPSRNLNQHSSRAPMDAFREGASPSTTTPPANPLTDSGGTPGRTASRPINSGRRSSGGLSGQYSTSVPSGGYFPQVAENDPLDDRQRQKDEKQRALKAAWGIDEPEPFEDFGSSPRDDTIELGSPPDFSSPRSSGFRMGFAGHKSPPPGEDQVITFDNAAGDRGSFSRPGGGPKRSKSFMQRLKSMRRENSRSPSKNSPSTEVPPMPADAAGHTARASFGNTLRPSPAREHTNPTTAYFAHEEELAPNDPDPVAVAMSAATTTVGGMTDRGGNGSSYPSGARTGTSTAPGAASGTEWSITGTRRPSNSLPSFARKSDKGLPLPPVGPVMPEFEETYRTDRTERDRLRRLSNGMNNGGSGGSGSWDDGAVKRRTSVVKRLRDKVAK